MANKQQVYDANFLARDKAAVLIGCTVQDIDNFVEKRLVKKEGLKDDQRVVYVSLTERGRKLHQQADEKIIGHNIRLSPKECQQLIELLMKI